ncbi:cysteine hydrolase family protein [Paenibacillus thailandensis]|uniref:Cysteine hydrolase family protein n=1 Tax=Paenibacillus thailandensis TaxID=393250 RepID=A0ABW5QWE5_9BACL
MKIGLLIVDMQNQFVYDGQIPFSAVTRASEYINLIADSLRASNHVVVHIRDVEEWTEETSDKFDVIPEIKVEETDLHVTKMYSNAFWYTDLEEQLKNHGVGFVIVAGFAAEYCVLFTYNGARERGFRAVILQDGILSTKSDVIPATYRDRQMISYSAVEYMAADR